MFCWRWASLPTWPGAVFALLWAGRTPRKMWNTSFKCWTALSHNFDSCRPLQPAARNLTATLIRLSALTKVPPAVVPVLLFMAALGFAGCAETSPNIGQFFKGRTLHVSVAAMDRLPELRYSVVQRDGELTHLRIAPSDDTMELVVLRVRVQNHTATSAVFTLDKEGAQLRDFDSKSYLPLDVGESAEEITEPPGPKSESRKVLELKPDGTFDTSRGFIRGAIELQRGTGLDGWIVFEAPKETLFRDFRWQAGDSVTIHF